MDKFYENCAFPKPKTQKKKKKVNGYKDKVSRRCFYTGRPCAERHELFGGANRQNSIDYGMQIDLCPELHKLFHGIKISRNDLESLGIQELTESPEAWIQKELQYHRKYAQNVWELKFMLRHGGSAADARAAWMELVGTNYDY